MSGLKEIAERVALALPGARGVDHSCLFPKILLDGGMAVCLAVKKGRIEVSGWYPVGYVPKGEPVISVAASRSPEEIAKEISRRFMEAYVREYRQAVERKVADEEFAKGVEETARRLAGAIGARWDPDGDSRTVVLDNPGGGFVVFSVRSPGEVKVEAWLSADEAELVAKVLKEEWE